jgi:hypothetical protein
MHEPYEKKCPREGIHDPSEECEICGHNPRRSGEQQAQYDDLVRAMEAMEAMEDDHE